MSSLLPNKTPLLIPNQQKTKPIYTIVRTLIKEKSKKLNQLTCNFGNQSHAFGDSSTTDESKS